MPPQSGLDNATKILQAADALQSIADTAQDRLLKGIQDGSIKPAQSQEIHNYISQIRNVTNLLYTSAATSVVKSLASTQQQVLAVINGGKQALSVIATTKAMIDLLADVVVLAGAINAGSVLTIPTALSAVKQDIDSANAPV